MASPAIEPSDCAIAGAGIVMGAPVSVLIELLKRIAAYKLRQMQLPDRRRDRKNE